RKQRLFGAGDILVFLLFIADRYFACQSLINDYLSIFLWPTATIKYRKTPKSISLRNTFFCLALSVATMGLLIYFTYTPGVLKHLKPKRLPGLGIAVVVSFLRLWFVA